MRLTLVSRLLIFSLKESNFSLRQIANELKVNVSAVSREISRNTINEKYNAQRAHNRAIERDQNKKKKKSKLSKDLMSKIIFHLTIDRWSPDQISGRLKEEFNIKISCQTTYRMIYKDRNVGGKLYKNLRRHGKKYRQRIHGSLKKEIIKNRIDISFRPDIVDKKIRYGDWECDTIIGKDRKGAITTLVGA